VTNSIHTRAPPDYRCTPALCPAERGGDVVSTTTCAREWPPLSEEWRDAPRSPRESSSSSSEVPDLRLQLTDVADHPSLLEAREFVEAEASAP
jgi:hypothetical protein